MNNATSKRAALKRNVTPIRTPTSYLKSPNIVHGSNRSHHTTQQSAYWWSTSMAVIPHVNANHALNERFMQPCTLRGIPSPPTSLLARSRPTLPQSTRTTLAKIPTDINDFHGWLSTLSKLLSFPKDGTTFVPAAAAWSPLLLVRECCWRIDCSICWRVKSRMRREYEDWAAWGSERSNWVGKEEVGEDIFGVMWRVVVGVSTVETMRNGK